MRAIVTSLVTATLVLTLGIGTARAGGIFVDPNDPGCVSGSGQADPYAVTYCNIQDAIDDAGAGDTVHIAAGTYESPLNIEGRSGLTLAGDDRDTVIVQPASTLDWGDPYGSDRQVAVRVYNSTDVVVSGLTLDFDLVRGNQVYGVLYWNSTGTVSQCRLENMSVDDLSGGYSEITTYLRAPDYSDGARATVTFSDNELIDTGRVGVLTHQFVDATISNNIFYKTTDDFGYAVELGSESIGTISDNTVYGFDTPAAVDGSSSAGIYIENSFTTGDTALTKPVTVDENEVYDCQYALWIGNGADGYAGDVAIVATVSGNNFHDNIDGAVLVQDEDAEAGSSVDATFKDNTLASNGQTGFFIFTNGDGDITATLTRQYISGHDVGVYLNDYAPGASASSYNVTVERCIVVGNASYGVQNDYAGTVITAKPNVWWGSADGPEDTDSGTDEVTDDTCGDYTVAEMLNAVGESTGVLGNKVSDNVDYCPWRQQYGDVDGDGDVDLSDLAALLAAYGTCSGDAGYLSAADFDGSGCIDLSDLAILLATYGGGV